MKDYNVYTAKQFSGLEWLAISFANACGKDKITLEERVDWAMDNIARHKELSANAGKDEGLVYRSALAIKEALTTGESNHRVELDMSQSGIQLMSCMTRCEESMKATNLWHSDQMRDAYMDAFTAMKSKALGDAANGIEQKVSADSAFHRKDFTRDDLKKPIMTFFYNKSRPDGILGEREEDIEVFNQTLSELFEGPYNLREALNGIWGQYMQFDEGYAYTGFDLFDAHVKYKTLDETMNYIDIANTTVEFKHSHYVYGFNRRAKCIVANPVHTADGSLCSEVTGKANYDPRAIEALYDTIQNLNLGSHEIDRRHYLPVSTVKKMATKGIGSYGLCELLQAKEIIEDMLTYAPAPVVTIHDAFTQHASTCNAAKHHFNRSLANLYASNYTSQLLNQLSKGNVTLDYEMYDKSVYNRILNNVHGLT